MAIDQQSRAELNYEWVATYVDGSEIRQYDDQNDVEHTFGDVDQDKLKTFSVKKRSGDKSISVDLSTGLFSINGEVVSSVEDNGVMRQLGRQLPEGVRVRPIYFRRVLRVGNDTRSMEPYIFHFVGWQGEVDGKYEKHEVGLSNNTDELVLPPKETFRML